MSIIRKKNIFISFDFADQDKVRYIVEQLENKYNISCWICLKDVVGGQKYKKEIDIAIDNSDALVVVISKDSIESTEVPKEVGLALTKDKPVIPFRLDESELRGELAYDLIGTNYVDGTVPTFDDRIEDLATAVKKFVHDESYHSSDIANTEGFIIEDGILLGYRGDSDYITIPHGITGIGITAFIQNEYIKVVNLPEGVSYIGDAAFCSCVNLEKINFPKSLTYIGKDAFFSCEKIKHVEFPDNLMTIGENAFGGCIGLKELRIPKRLLDIGTDSFSGCTSLKNISVDEDSETFCCIDDCLYDILCHNLYIAPAEKTHFEFPNELGNIGRVFKNNPFIETIVLPDGIERIGDNAFKGCEKLKKITLGRRIKTIGRAVFYGDDRLEQIIIKTPIAEIFIDDKAFLGCPDKIIKTIVE